MPLRPYQIHSVLRTYANRLIRQKETPVRDQTRIPLEGKRQSVIKRVADDIISKITQIGLSHSSVRKAYSYGTRSETKETLFRYYRIDKDNQKRPCTFSVKNSRDLIKDLGEME